MARSIWQKTITNETGDIQDGVQITVNVQGGGLATIYDNQSGGTAKANPFLTGADGVAKFFSEPGFYEVTAFKNGETATFEWNNIGDSRVREDLADPAIDVPIVDDNGDSVIELRKQLAESESEVIVAGLKASQLKGIDGIKSLESVTLKDRAQYDVSGFYAGTEIGGGQFIYDASRPKADHNGGTVITPEAIAAWDGTPGGLSVLRDWTGAGTGAFVRIHSVLPEVSISWFGGSTYAGFNNTPVVLKALSVSKTVHSPEGVYEFQDELVITSNGVKIVGENSETTIWKYTGSKVDNSAFSFNPDGAGYIQGVGASNMTFEGNAESKYILKLRGVGRSHFKHLLLKEAKHDTDGGGLALIGCHLSSFSDVICSQNHHPDMVNVPYSGLLITSINPYGNSSNNTFTACHFEGTSTNVPVLMQRGINLQLGTQNTFIGGSPEACGEYGLHESGSCNYNTFIGVAFENARASQADVLAAGDSTTFLNCYASKRMVLQGRSSIIKGGYYQRIETTVDSIKAKVEDVALGNWESVHPGTYGFFDNGINTEWSALYDLVQDKYIYPLKGREGLSIGSSSPTTYTNNKGEFRQIIINGGQVDSITVTRNGVSWQVPSASPSSTLLAPGDEMEVVWTTIPTLFFSIPMNSAKN